MFPLMEGDAWKAGGVLIVNKKSCLRKLYDLGLVQNERMQKM